LASLAQQIEELFDRPPAKYGEDCVSVCVSITGIFFCAAARRPLAIVDGMARASTRPGNGLEWNAEAVRRYRMA